MKRVGIAVAVVCASIGASLALQVRETASRFDALVIADPTRGLDVATTAVETLPAGDVLRAGWESFRAEHGRDWSIHLDRRSGAPLLVEGKGVALGVGEGASLEAIEPALRAFIAARKPLLLADDAELQLSREASGEINPGVWQVVFDRTVSGVPVAGERYLFTVGHGKLISFGAPHWSAIGVSVHPALDAAAAATRLTSYMKIAPTDRVEAAGAPTLEVIPMRSAPLPSTGSARYTGPVGAGYASALVWRVAVRVAGEPGLWVGLVDAHSGKMRAFFDDVRYVRVKGGTYPLSDDQNCPDGCEQPGTVMPFADITIGASSSFGNTLGTFNCTPSGSQATTALAGQYVKVLDQCGPTSQAVTCSADLDLGTSAGTDCAVPAGSSVGNTHAARSSFYHLNRIAEHARTWLPTRSWLAHQLPDYVNINASCNAYWDGQGVNFFKSSASCNNTGEIAGVFLHEWGHGLDQNDGGDFDNPSEAYADITSLMQTHVSCIGRGFRKFGNCGGYGNVCLSCSGVRDQDWDQRADHTPSTPAGFVATHCAGGGAPCGGEEHCEGYVSGEALWDLATRDLPATGLDSASAWYVADKLWYKSRLGSGGDAYNCVLPESDGCLATSWFEKIRAADDDDSDLSNGTPHAAAIFAAFDRHAIACGTAADAANQNSGTCPALSAPVLTGTAGPTSAALAWTSVPGSIGIRILRNDAGCQAATSRLSNLTGSSFTDNGLVNGLPLYYNVQAIASNGACDGPLSNCVAVTPQSAAATISLDASSYACTGQVSVTVVDGNAAGGTVTVSFTSTTEATAESIVASRIAPGSATYSGTISLTNAAPVHDGVLSVADGNTITARYIDANDGLGHVNLQRVKTAVASCPPVNLVKPVADGSFGTPMTASRADVSGASIGLTWDVATCSSPDHHLLYGDLSSVATLSITGGVCDLGTSGAATWSGVPAGDLWFVVVGDDGSSVEGSWGKDGTGAERGGNSASGDCGMTSRNNSGSCP